jgi:helix-turn-helix protein
MILLHFYKLVWVFSTEITECTNAVIDADYSYVVQVGVEVELKSRQKAS